MSKTYVIAGTNHEAQYWIINDLGKRYPTNTSLTMSHYVYVSHANDLRGIQNPHGVFVGNWLGRPDILEIVEQLMMCSTVPNPALGKIYKDLLPKVRPTPKLRGINPTQVYIDEAASLMAQQIDAEIVANIAKRINGGII